MSRDDPAPLGNNWEIRKGKIKMKLKNWTPAAINKEIKKITRNGKDDIETAMILIQEDDERDGIWMVNIEIEIMRRWEDPSQTITVATFKSADEAFAKGRRLVHQLNIDIDSVEMSNC